MAAKALMVLVNTPAPVPSVVFVLKLALGFVDVLHTTPRAVTVLPPSVVTLPPLVAELVVIAETVVVVTVGGPGVTQLQLLSDQLLPAGH